MAERDRYLQMSRQGSLQDETCLTMLRTGRCLTLRATPWESIVLLAPPGWEDSVSLCSLSLFRQPRSLENDNMGGG